MNIAIGKIGRFSYFDPKSWSIYAGDDSPKIIFSELARRFPQHTFYYVSVNDITKCRDACKPLGGFGMCKKTCDIPDNIVDIYHSVSLRIAGIEKYKDGEYPHEILLDECKKRNLHFDFAIFEQGPDCGFSVMNRGIWLTSHPDRHAVAMAMANHYCGPLISFINEMKMPWVNITEDPRYVPSHHKDILNDELCVLSQITTDIETQRIAGYYDESHTYRHPIQHFRYAGIEKMFLRDMVKVDFKNPDEFKVGNHTYRKSNTFIMTLNGTPDRLPFIENWVLKYKPDTKIYGKWDEEAKAKYPNTFKEKGIVEIPDEMWQSKFTFVPCFDKKLSNFVTQKVWKMIYYGIIPFWDKNSYDTDHYYNEIPDYFKVASPDEMWQKIEYLEKNPDEYKKYLSMYYNLLEDKYFNGDFIYETFKPFIEKYDPKLKVKE